MSKIEWTDETWNPTTGCAKVSTGCKNCYAEKMSKRLAAMGQEKYQGIMTDAGRFNGTVRTHLDELSRPFTWKKPRRVFVNSMSDLFHEDVPFEFIDMVFAVMMATPQHTYQILTKRPERMAEWFNRKEISWQQEGMRGRERIRYQAYHSFGKKVEYDNGRYWPLPNVWLGTSVENQETANERIPHLLECPAAVRFLSCEPLLGAVDLSTWMRPHTVHAHISEDAQKDPEFMDVFVKMCNLAAGMISGINWLIAGGESGTDARPMHPDWARSLRDQCKEAGVAFFFKQWGNWCAPDQYDFAIGKPSLESCKRHVFEDGTEVYNVGKKAAGNLLDGRKHEEFPTVAKITA